MSDTSWSKEFRDWSALVAWWAIVLFAGWIVLTQVVQRPDCVLPAPPMEKGK